MITQAILEFLFNTIEVLFSSLPIMDINIDVSLINSFSDYVAMAAYFFPWKTVISIIAITGLFIAWRIVITLVRLIAEVLPFV